MSRLVFTNKALASVRFSICSLMCRRIGYVYHVHMHNTVHRDYNRLQYTLFMSFSPLTRYRRRKSLLEGNLLALDALNNQKLRIHEENAIVKRPSGMTWHIWERSALPISPKVPPRTEPILVRKVVRESVVMVLAVTRDPLIWCMRSRI